MASYTMQLKEYIEMWSQSNPDLSHRERIEIGRKKLFDFDYPIFDPSYKKVLETHFIREFYTREIGFETEELFKFRLETWFSINMPYFNQLFKSELLEYDPLTNSKMLAKHKKTTDTEQKAKVNTKANSKENSSGSSNTNDDNFSRELQSDTPDSRLSITTKDGQGVIEYASAIGEANQNNKQTTSGNSTSDSNTVATNEQDTDINEVEDYVQERLGKIGVQTYPDMVAKFRNSFIRIEKDMFEELQRLFMLVY